jgi:hypothetical protein
MACGRSCKLCSTGWRLIRTPNFSSEVTACSSRVPIPFQKPAKRCNSSKARGLISAWKVKSPMQWRVIMQHHRELMQRRIAKTFCLDRGDRREHIFAVDAGLAVALSHVAQLLGQ